MWFKKKAYISGYNSNTAVDGTDWRTTTKNYTWSVSQTLPSAADAGNYFYVPALGYYVSGQLNNVVSNSFYWSSSAPAGNTYYAYSLDFSSAAVGVNYHNRDGGFRVGVFE